MGPQEHDLDFFHAAGSERDSRMAEAIQLIENKRQPDGRWPLENSYNEAPTSPMTETIGKASRLNTLCAMRVLRWYHQA